ncbi:uncharacterized protein LOC127844862 [Dreissena polymorpha]|uniref:uncharacterized protein LOC127844862 n=1 Tax=Dreissena polymorpha TaxID=45954 RepID=UPI002263AF19|nr:uncharacterized protein LOC127844862 [Dreissena polymorpha]
MGICDNGGIIFVGNTTVLLIIALTTDYWEYREVVRARIGLNFSRPRNCLYVLFSEDSKNDELQHASELAFLKSMACACAVGCIVLVGAAFVTGWHATFLRFPNTRLFHIASIMSLSAGFLLTIGIALFHGRCYVLRKMELFPGQDVPFKDLIHRSKVYSYGWSFDLAWLCVACSYISAYIWLRKGHGTRRTIANADTTLSRATQKKVTCLVNWKPHKTMSPTTIATI